MPLVCLFSHLREGHHVLSVPLSFEPLIGQHPVASSDPLQMDSVNVSFSPARLFWGLNICLIGDIFIFQEM